MGAAAPIISTIGTIASAASTVSGLLGGGDSQEAPEMPAAPKLAPTETKEAESVLEDEAAKLRSLKRRQASTQKLFSLDDDDSTLLGK